jgi:hypothetical protein
MTPFVYTQLPGRVVFGAGSLGAPVALKAIGMPEGDLDRAAGLATTSPYWSPRPIERAAIRALLDRAYHGTPPGWFPRHSSPLDQRRRP